MIGLALLVLAATVDAGPPVPPTPESRCVEPQDLSRGWKALPLPPGERWSAAQAPAQFMLGDEVIWTSRDSPRVLSRDGEGDGRTTWVFALAPGTDQLEAIFGSSLGGAKVSVVAYSEQGTRHELIHEERSRDVMLSLRWEVPRVRELEVSVHHHFRAPPDLVHWRTKRRVVIGEGDALPLEFHAAHTLYYFQPGNHPLRICPAPSSASPPARADFDEPEAGNVRWLASVPALSPQ